MNEQLRTKATIQYKLPMHDSTLEHRATQIDGLPYKPEVDQWT